ncbi:MAG: 2-vinyl bacteriochlorophyllide hydratase [Vulcanimicrobiaceae bacterium]
MPKPEVTGVLSRRKASIWTKIHPLFAIGQLLAFFVSVGFLVAYFRGGVPFHDVHVTVLIKISLMVGAVITGSLWEKDVFGHWWFAPEFMSEDLMTLIVFITQMSYLGIAMALPGKTQPLLLTIGLAYFVYALNVAQYIHRTQQMNKDAATLRKGLKKAA